MGTEFRHLGHLSVLHFNTFLIYHRSVFRSYIPKTVEISSGPTMNESIYCSSIKKENNLKLVCFFHNNYFIFGDSINISFHITSTQQPQKTPQTTTYHIIIY